MKKILFSIFIFLVSLILNINSTFASCLTEYWIWAKDNFNWTCSCYNWYHFETSTFWNTSCVKDKTCKDLYWIMAKDNYDWTCSCMSWYWFKDKTFWWWKECVSLNTICEDKLWFNAEYNSLYDKCECSYWYDLKPSYTSINWSNYSCESCYSIYWLNSKYDSVNKTCWCKDWYTLKDWKCVEKSNSAYFYLSEYNDDTDEAVVYSYYNKRKYLLELRYVSWLYKAENFVWKSIVINMWTDFDIDRYDKFVLNNETTTTDIVTDILSVEEVNDDYTLKTCKDIYWYNSVDLWNWKCWCKNWYEWSWNICILAQSPTISFVSTSTTSTSSNYNTSLSYNIKSSIDKVFQNLKNKLSSQTNNKKLEIYNSLISKINIVTSTNTKQLNKDILNYLKSLIEDEISNLENN